MNKQDAPVEIKVSGKDARGETPLGQWSLPVSSTTYLIAERLVGQSVCLEVGSGWTVSVSPETPTGESRSCSEPITEEQGAEVLFTIVREPS